MSPHEFEPPIQPPPIQVSAPANPYEASKVPGTPPADWSGTDGRTVASLTFLGVGLMTFLMCYILGPIPSIAGLILAVFARPSALRTVALAGNGLMLGVSFLWVVWLFWEMFNNPISG